ncbi:MAG: hypothetical protein K2Y32_02700 [Candidatus Obscuribacterales bacterium]|uniref:Uncharacterized protein n=1 Tax=Candidatus Obscuribacter phosphatis TaxID=1906157 RepID=A0A8J7PIQ7_9BACT|nr:hypothetical protein [Candidatus Obscuribacter phosphatis]MBX9938131.1 hypothetical protein [Candidatus Obscuribacterales bacterium]
MYQFRFPKRLLALAMLAACTLTLPAQAGPKLITGTEQWENVNYLLTEIPWYQSLSQAQEAARQKGKMVFYMHILGKLNGAT